MNEQKIDPPSILRSTNGMKLLKDYIEMINSKYPDDCHGDDKYKLKETKVYSHYFKDVSNLKEIDIYRVLELWNVSHPCLQHAAKKILVAGNRGHKNITKDIQEAIDSLVRWKEMQKEDKYD